MATNRQVVEYLRDHVRGKWQDYFSLDELMEVHVVANNLKGFVRNFFPVTMTQKELISNIAKDEVVWLDGINATALAMVYLSPAIPTCKEVHVNISAEALEALYRLQRKLGEDKYQAWQASLVAHHVSSADIKKLETDIPEQLDTAIVTGVGLTQPYLEALLAKLKVGGLLWIESSTLGGHAIEDPRIVQARFNDWLVLQSNLEVSMGIDGVTYSLIRKAA